MGLPLLFLTNEVIYFGKNAPHFLNVGSPNYEANQRFVLDFNTLFKLI